MSVCVSWPIGGRDWRNNFGAFVCDKVEQGAASCVR